MQIMMLGAAWCNTCIDLTGVAIDLALALYIVWNHEAPEVSLRWIDLPSVGGRNIVVRSKVVRSRRSLAPLHRLPVGDVSL